MKADYYEDYAKYLMDFVDAYEKGLGIDIYAMSGWNEPDVLSSMGGWASCSWSVDQMAKFVLENLRPEMNKRGHSDMKLVYARMPGGHGLLNILIQALKSILNWQTRICCCWSRLFHNRCKHRTFRTSGKA